MQFIKRISLALAFCLPSLVTVTGSSLPQVDLGYEVHEALSFDESPPRQNAVIHQVGTSC